MSARLCKPGLERSHPMTISRQTGFRIAVLIVGIATFMFSPGLLPNQPPPQPRRLLPPRGEPEEPARRETRMWPLRITPWGEPPVTVSQLEGRPIKTGLKGKTVYCFLPILSDRAKGTFTIGVYTANRESGLSTRELDESFKQVDALVVRRVKGVAYYQDDEASFKIEILTVQTVDGPVERIQEIGLQSLKSDNFCLVCRGRETCACSASTVCGAALLHLIVLTCFYLKPDPQIYGLGCA